MAQRDDQNQRAQRSRSGVWQKPDERDESDAADNSAGRWRLCGIATQSEAEAWIRAGVFDGYRAGLLKSAGLAPGDLEGVVDENGKDVGYEFALGRLGSAEVIAHVRAQRWRPILTKAAEEAAKVESSSITERRPILLVEDDPDSRSGMAEVLRNQGFDVVELSNGREALDYLMTKEAAAPSVIVLDLAMPEMSGWEFIAIIKSFYKFANIPLLVVSGRERPVEAVRYGVIHRYIPKPHDPESLANMVSSLAQKS